MTTLLGAKHDRRRIANLCAIKLAINEFRIWLRSSPAVLSQGKGADFTESYLSGISAPVRFVRT